MKRTATLIAAACLVAGSAAAQAPSRTDPGQLRDVVWARDIGSGTITVDGNINEPEWAQAESFVLTQDGTQPTYIPGGGAAGRDAFNGSPSPDPGQATVRYLRKGNMFYISADVQDKSIGGIRDFFAGDGLVMAIVERAKRDMAFADGIPDGRGTNANMSELFYSWMNIGFPGQSLPVGADSVGTMPIFYGSFVNNDGTIRDDIVTGATVVNGVSNDDRNGTGALTPDVGYSMEVSIDLAKLGYDMTKPGGDRVTFTVSVYDRDNQWPIGQDNLYQGRSWFQGLFGNSMNNGSSYILGNPDVTTTSGAVPNVNMPFVTIPTVTPGSRITVDGQLDESAWTETMPQVTLKYRPSLAMINALPGDGPYVHGWFRAGLGIPAPLPAVADTSTGAIRFIFRDNMLYVGLDSDDQAINGQTLSTDRFDGLRVGIRDLSPDMADNYIEGNPVPSRRFTMVVDSMGTARLLEDAKDNPAVQAAAFLKEGSTAGNADDIDAGYQMEMAIDLSTLGVDVSNGLVWITATYFDGDDLQDPNSSYGTRSWWLAEGNGAGTGPPARSYLDPTIQVGTAAGDGPDGGASFRTLGAAPNPFGGVAALRYELASTTDVTVEVFDVLGRRVGRIDAGTQTAGAQSVRFDASALSPGAYVYRVRTADGSMATGRLLVAR